MEPTYREIMERLDAIEEGPEANTLDIDKVAANINQYVQAATGMNPNLTSENASTDSSNRYQFISSNLALEVHPRMFTEFTVSAGPIVRIDDGTYHCRIHFNYSHFNGGRNGMEIGTVWFNEDGTIRANRDVIAGGE